MTKLLIARHGNTFGANDILRRVGKTDLPLVDTGLAQGRALGKYLKQHALIPDFIYTSELLRTKQTAEQAQISLGTTLPLQELAIFNEIDYGPDENQPETIVKERLGQSALQAWEERAIVPDGWNFDPDSCIKNWWKFAKDIAENHSGKTILVVTSNGIGRFSPHLTGDFANFSQKNKIKIATGKLCIFKKTDNDAYWKCEAWNVI